MTDPTATDAPSRAASATPRPAGADVRRAADEPAGETAALRRRSGTERRLRYAPQIGVRLDPMEHEALLLRAEIAGLTPADYLRKRGLGTAARVRRPPESDLEATRKLLKHLIGLVGAMGNNVNQIAHQVNLAALAGQSLPVGVEAVHDLNGTMRALRAELRGLAGVRDAR